MQTLIRDANKLPGTEPELNNQQSKTIIFRYFPMQWQQVYIRSGRNIRTDNLMDIVQYMEDEKGFSDAVESCKRKLEQQGQQGGNRSGGDRGHNRNNQQRGWGRGRGRGGSNNNNQNSNHNGNNRNNNDNGRRSNPCLRWVQSLLGLGLE